MEHLNLKVSLEINKLLFFLSDVFTKSTRKNDYFVMLKSLLNNIRENDTVNQIKLY